MTSLIGTAFGLGLEIVGCICVNRHKHGIAAALATIGVVIVFFSLLEH